MATAVGTRGLVRWGTGNSVTSTAATAAIIKTRKWEINMNANTVEDTGHGDTVKSYAVTFLDFGCKIDALWDNSATGSKLIISDAMAKTAGRFYLYPDSSVTSQYWSGVGYLGIDTHSAPYDNFGDFNFSIIAASPSSGVSPVGYQG